MHPLTAGRFTSGQFYTIMSELKQDSCKFRCRKNSSDHLLSLLKTHIGKADQNMRKGIPAEERLAITLRWTLDTSESGDTAWLLVADDAGGLTLELWLTITR
ncbi:hypothetical protein PR048_022448 [Dryococelus australis]|uniref:Uncharacterized protein n=1 Tax=Dryococelus australis TaxID=614101 RepID=A0ABQ9H127_9NEOP|nr:hypothetical protein PR048_022448 [Dryococelus australis]